MKSLIYKILILLLIHTVLWNGVKKCLLPKHWGNVMFSTKYKHIVENIDTYDRFVIGSSTVYRHYDTQQIEKQLGGKWYNLGVPGMFRAERDILINELVEILPDDKKIVLYIEETEMERLDQRNLHSARTKYFLNHRNWLKIITYYLQKKNIKQIFFFTISYVENALCIGEMKAMSRSLSKKDHKYGVMIHRNQGFLSIDDQISLFPSDTTILLRRNRGFELPMMEETDMSIREVTFKEFGIQEKKENIKLFLISKSTLSSDPEHYFDEWHLNAVGAKILTEEFITRCKEIDKITEPVN